LFFSRDGKNEADQHTKFFVSFLFLLGIVLFIHRPEQSRGVKLPDGFFGLGINILLLFYIHFFSKIITDLIFSAIWEKYQETSFFFF